MILHLSSHLYKPSCSFQTQGLLCLSLLHKKSSLFPENFYHTKVLWALTKPPLHLLFAKMNRLSLLYLYP